MEYDTLDDLINNTDSIQHLSLDVEETTFDCDMSGTITHEDGSESHFYLHNAKWRFLETK